MEGESNRAAVRERSHRVRRAVHSAAWPAVLLFVCTVSVAEPPGKSPARFLPDAESLEANIVFPPLSGDFAVWINCTAIVLAAGKMRGNWCFADGENSAWFKNAIHTAVRELRLQPAIVNGKPVPARMNYRVLFLSAGDARDVRVFQNWGYDVPRFGDHYLGPQRYSAMREYPSSCVGTVRTIVARVTVTVDVAGRPGEEAQVDFAEESASNGSCTRALQRLHRNAKYIPAERDGTPVEAMYTELWGDYGRIALAPGG